MLPLCLSAVLLAAPIPKHAKDGTIAVFLEGKESQVLLITPDGREIKRVAFDGYKGNAFKMIVSATCDQIVFACYEREVVRIVGKHQYSLMNCYQLKLAEGAKPKLLFNDKLHSTISFGKGSDYLFGSETYYENIANNPAAERKYKSWKLNLKTGKFESIPLPNHNMIVDISRDGRTALTYFMHESNIHVGTAQTSDWKPKRISEKPAVPFCISADGQLAIMEYCHPSNGGVCYVNLKTNRIQDIPDSNLLKSTGQLFRTLSPDSKKFAFLESFQEEFDGETQYRSELCICDLDGTNRKKIFETKTSENLIVRDVVWR